MELTAFAAFFSACLAAAATGMIFQPGSWYERLNKPSWTPPRLAFPVVWTILYIVIAIAAARVASVPGSGTALAFWSLQITLNTLWTPVFFGGHHKRAGLVVITLLWLTVAVMIPQFWALDGYAAVLLLPYLAWLSVATALNFWIWRNNPDGS